jgi:hypothetical protein
LGIQRGPTDKSFLVLFFKKERLSMPKMRKKTDLRTKVCEVCKRPFTWRKKWALVWDDVRYCSDACRRARGNHG